MKPIQWAAWNTVVFVAFYFAAILGAPAAKNITYFVVWLTVICALCIMLDMSKWKASAKPTMGREFNLFVTLMQTVVLIAGGWWWTGILYFLFETFMLVTKGEDHG